jgi:hypothetical protein
VGDKPNYFGTILSRRIYGVPARHLIKHAVVGVSLIWASMNIYKKDVFIRQIVNENNQYEETVKNLNITIGMLVDEISRNSVDLDIVPRPIWYKVYNPQDKTMRMVFINREFEKRYDVTREQYLGKTDRQIFGNGASELWRKHDLEVVRTSRPTMFTEYDEDGIGFQVLKWRVDRSGIIFIYGMSIGKNQNIRNGNP